MDPVSTLTKAKQVELLGMAQGFVASAVLFSLCRLGVFSILGKKELSSASIAAVTDAPTHRLERLLDAGVMLGLLHSGRRGQYSVATPLIAILTDESDPSYLGDWLAFMSRWYVPFGELDRVAKADLSESMYESDAATLRSNTLAMDNFATSRGREIVDFVDLTGTRSLLDVGCGPGTYSFELGKKFPGVELNLLDGPEVLEIAREVMARYELFNRVNFLPFDLAVDTIHGSYDTILVSNVLQAFDSHRVRQIVQDLFGAVASGGSIIVQAQFIDADRHGPRWPTYVDLACLCFTPAGRNHSASETIEWLRDAGFTDVHFEPMSLMNANGLVRGFRK